MCAHSDCPFQVHFFPIQNYSDPNNEKPHKFLSHFSYQTTINITSEQAGKIINLVDMSYSLDYMKAIKNVAFYLIFTFHL